MDFSSRCESHFGTSVTVACKFLSWFPSAGRVFFYGLRSAFPSTRRRDSAISFECNLILKNERGKSPYRRLFGLIRSRISDRAEPEVCRRLCAASARVAYCYFWQLRSKMSSASINSYKSNIHYAAIANLFIFSFFFF